MPQADAAVTVQFSVRTGGGQFVVEPEASAIEASDLESLYGRVLINVDRGNDTDGDAVFVEDDLTALVANICFQAPTQLSVGEPFAAYINRYWGDVHMEPTGSSVRIFGNSVFTPDGQADAELTVPAEELLAALHGCGCRALRLLHDLFGKDPTQADALNGLEGLREESAAATR